MDTTTSPNCESMETILARLDDDGNPHRPEEIKKQNEDSKAFPLSGFGTDTILPTIYDVQ
jgi:hypothetical protein